MEKIKLSVKFEKKFFYTKIIFILTLSYFLYLSFRQVLFFSESNLFFFIIFFLFQIIFIFIIFKKNYLFFNLFFLIFLNIIFTPVFFHYSFDVPYRYPNTKEVLEYDENYHHGLFKGVHTISRDERGNRVNKSINYKNKNNKTFRILAIGASTTEQEGLGDNYIWSNKLVRKLKENKIGNYDNYEIINFGIGGVRAIHNYFTIERNLNLEPDLVIFLLGINDWNNHIVNREINYIFPYIETNFNFEKSLLYKLFYQINKTIQRKIIKKEKKVKKEINIVKSKNRYKEFIEEQINSKKLVKKIINFKIDDVSYEYKFWTKKIASVCKEEKIKCLFVDQPSMYDEANIKKNIKIWMNPPFKNYSLNFRDNMNLARKYNNYLEKLANKNNQYFCKLSSYIKPIEYNFIDDAHFTPLGSEKVANYIFKCAKRFMKG